MGATIIIRKQHLRVLAGTEAAGMAIRQQLDDAWMSRFAQTLSDACRHLDLDGENVFLPSIKVELNAGMVGQDADEWIAPLAHSIHDQLVSRLQQGSGEMSSAVPQFQGSKPGTSPEQDALSPARSAEAFFHFAEHGTLPWWCRHLSFHPGRWLKTVLGEQPAAFVRQHRQYLRRQGRPLGYHAVRRMVDMLDEANREKLLQHLLSGSEKFTGEDATSAWQQLNARAPQLAAPAAAILLECLLTRPVEEWEKWVKEWVARLARLSPSSPPSGEDDQSWLAVYTRANLATRVEMLGALMLPGNMRDMAPMSLGEGTEAAPDQFSADAAETAGHIEGWHTPHAGLVLLHPFLQYLFKYLGLLDEADQFAGEAAQHKAVHLLVFLAGGSASAPWEWTMEKWLCGLDMDAFVPAALSLTEAEVLACDQLLQAVIGHWRPLNDSSTAALQETFLQRHGKLWPEGDGWHLALEKTGVDILLDQLPWGIGVIRLPWAAQNLFTTW